MASSDLTPEMEALTPQQRAFVREYLLNGRDAKNAGIKAGYAPSSAHATCYKLLQGKKVPAAIAAEEARLRARHDITLDRIIDELARVAFGGMGDFLTVNPDGVPAIDLSKASKADLHMLDLVEVETLNSGKGDDARAVGRVLKLKRLDKMKALEILGKHFGLGNKREEEAVDRFTQAMLELAQRGSAQPIGKGKP
jgi:phage terminase small subunit